MEWKIELMAGFKKKKKRKVWREDSQSWDWFSQAGFRLALTNYNSERERGGPLLAGASATHLE